MSNLGHHGPDGKWDGIGLGDTGVQVMLLQHKLIHAYPKNSQAVSLGVTESGSFDAATQQALANLQPFLKPPHAATGVADYATQLALGMLVPPIPVHRQPACVYFSINGAGSTWNMGYPYDIGEDLQPGVAIEDRIYYHQPIGYNTNPIPMNTGVNDGETEFVRQLWLPRPNFGGRDCRTIPYHYNFYSMGALVGMRVMARVWHGDLQMFASTCLGGSTFGNPRRQENHTFPGCINSDGMGIAQPNDHDVPDSHWDFAASKEMEGSGGDDLYTKIGIPSENAQTQKDMRAVWDIVNKGNPLSLAEAVAMLLLHPSFSGGYSAAIAAFHALGFFVVKQTGPHVRYQFTIPRAGDPRDCWALARQHAVDLNAEAVRLTTVAA